MSSDSKPEVIRADGQAENLTNASPSPQTHVMPERKDFVGEEKSDKDKEVQTPLISADVSSDNSKSDASAALASEKSLQEKTAKRSSGWKAFLFGLSSALIPTGIMVGLPFLIDFIYPLLSWSTATAGSTTLVGGTLAILGPLGVGLAIAGVFLFVFTISAYLNRNARNEEGTLLLLRKAIIRMVMMLGHILFYPIFAIFESISRLRSLGDIEKKQGPLYRLVKWSAAAGPLSLIIVSVGLLIASYGFGVFAAFSIPQLIVVGVAAAFSAWLLSFAIKSLGAILVTSQLNNEIDDESLTELQKVAPLEIRLRLAEISLDMVYKGFASIPVTVKKVNNVLIVPTDMQNNVEIVADTLFSEEFGEPQKDIIKINFDKWERKEKGFRSALETAILTGINKSEQEPKLRVDKTLELAKKLRGVAQKFARNTKGEKLFSDLASVLENLRLKLVVDDLVGKFKNNGQQQEDLKNRFNENIEENYKYKFIGALKEKIIGSLGGIEGVDAKKNKARQYVETLKAVSQKFPADEEGQKLFDNLANVIEDFWLNLATNSIVEVLFSADSENQQQLEFCRNDYDEYNKGSKDVFINLLKNRTLGRINGISGSDKKKQARDKCVERLYAIADQFDITSEGKQKFEKLAQEIGDTPLNRKQTLTKSIQSMTGSVKISMRSGSMKASSYAPVPNVDQKSYAQESVAVSTTTITIHRAQTKANLPASADMYKCLTTPTNPPLDPAVKLESYFSSDEKLGESECKQLANIVNENPNLVQLLSTKLTQKADGLGSKAELEELEKQVVSIKSQCLDKDLQLKLQEVKNSIETKKLSVGLVTASSSASPTASPSRPAPDPFS